MKKATGNRCLFDGVFYTTNLYVPTGREKLVVKTLQKNNADVFITINTDFPDD